MTAFFEASTWTQADLARRANTTTDVIRKTLESLQGIGWPLEREAEPPQVYWSLPAGWLPSGVLFPVELVSAVLRLLMRLPSSADRDAILERLTGQALEKMPEDGAWLHVEPTRREEETIREIEDAIGQRHASRLRYYSAHRGVQEERVVSFQRLHRATPIKVVGFCHRDGRLKWFRVDHVQEMLGRAEETYLEAHQEDLERFLSHTLLGFHRDQDAAPATFFVRNPEARWVQDNLPEPMRAEVLEDGIRVTVEGVSIRQVAKFVVGLAGAARPETSELASAVERIASAALEATR